jgi:hypothetical protein
VDLIEVNKEHEVVSKYGKAMQRGHGNDKGEQVVDKRV